MIWCILLFVLFWRTIYTRTDIRRDSFVVRCLLCSLELLRDDTCPGGIRITNRIVLKRLINLMNLIIHLFENIYFNISFKSNLNIAYGNLLHIFFKLRIRSHHKIIIARIL